LSQLRAALGSLVFLVLVPGIAAGLLPRALTGWQSRSPSAPLQVAGLVLVLAGADVLLALPRRDRRARGDGAQVGTAGRSRPRRGHLLKTER